MYSSTYLPETITPVNERLAVKLPQDVLTIYVFLRAEFESRSHECGENAQATKSSQSKTHRNIKVSIYN